MSRRLLALSRNLGGYLRYGLCKNRFLGDNEMREAENRTSEYSCESLSAVACFCFFLLMSMSWSASAKEDVKKKLDEKTGFTCITETSASKGVGTRCAPSVCWNEKETEIICESTMANSTHSTGGEDGFRRGDGPTNCTAAVRKTCSEIRKSVETPAKGEPADQLTSFGKKVKKDICGKEGRLEIIDEVWQVWDTEDDKKVRKTLKKDNLKRADLPRCADVRGNDKFKVSPEAADKVCRKGLFVEAPRTVWFVCKDKDGNSENGHKRFKKRKADEGV